MEKRVIREYEKSVQCLISWCDIQCIWNLATKLHLIDVVHREQDSLSSKKINPDRDSFTRLPFLMKRKRSKWRGCWLFLPLICAVWFLLRELTKHRIHSLWRCVCVILALTFSSPSARWTTFTLNHRNYPNLISRNTTASAWCYLASFRYENVLLCQRA